MLKVTFLIKTSMNLLFSLNNNGHINSSSARHLQQRKDFCSSVKFEQQATALEGAVSLDTFQELTDREELVFELRSCGLTDGQVDLWLAHIPKRKKVFETFHLSQNT